MLIKELEDFKIGCGGARRDRTADLVTASHALSQLSYSPKTSLIDCKSKQSNNSLTSTN